ncbi:MAG TPA: DUF962 domain-containing protein [Verrucomicrobiae bacterium]|nr:DUF962 domain-containing protein [Verrucomicrobiae bacterium]
MPRLAHYMAQYDHEHGSPWNKLLHGIGIPLIFAGIILLVLLRWRWGVSCFVGGWVLLLIGHRVEGNHPAFFQGPIYLLVGPIWVAKEIWTFLSGSERGQEHDALPPKQP